ncbi:tyrosine--tRNA ligase [Candidatus Latescibacterota bacterium]
MTLLEDLAWRGLIYQITDEEGLSRRLADGPVTLYCGFDPTADSLGVGNLVQILLLRRFQEAGHRPIALVGGGTGLIGDPGGKTEERQLQDRETVEAWAVSFGHQIGRFLDFDGPNGARMMNNLDWLGELSAIDLLRDVGKHFPVPYMLAKESVKTRLETGISFTEFSYMVLQSYDFLKLHELEGCELQIGGSDQWGNITAGSDFIRRSGGPQVYGLTCPLVTQADGTKFGKTEAGNVWIGADRTSPYEFYQFWINTPDASVVDYLKIFTLREREEIEALAESVANDPGKREAQRSLAGAVTELVHGDEARRKAEKISRALFYGELKDLEEDEIQQGFGDVPTWSMSEPELGLVDLLVSAGVVKAKRQAREDINNGAIYLNGGRCTDLTHVVRKQDGLHGRYHIIRRGKNKYFLVQ